jgi:hypothetical protein
MTDVASSTLGVHGDPPPRGRCRCGYDLRGIESRVCSECGKTIEALPQWVIKRSAPVIWPAKLGFWCMLLLAGLELLLLMPLPLSLFLWLCVFVSIMSRYWVRNFWFWRTRWRYGGLSPMPTERLALWRARGWFGLGLLVTLLSVPQYVGLLVDLPWLNKAVHRVYEVEPLESPHHLSWCGLHPVSNLTVTPSGVYFEIGMRDAAYSPQGLPWQFDTGYEKLIENLGN